MGISSCTQPIPRWSGKIWAGDSATSSIQRAQDVQAIGCNEAVFDNYLCMSYADFQTFYETYVLGCKKWDKDLERMSPQEAFEIIKAIRPQKVTH
jgi:hypothetical protein